MILKFPDLDTLRLSITTGAVPDSIHEASAKVGFDEEDQIWLQPSSKLTSTQQRDVRKLGISVGKRAAVSLNERVNNWIELFPLQTDPDALALPDQAPVLFEMGDGQELARLASEILRLGNDRQSFRWLSEELADSKRADKASSSNPRALLRVVGPPYYSLLRALDQIGDEKAPRAFVEQSPRVWVELGYRHPFIDQISAPEDQMLILTPERHWIYLDNSPFTDVYEIVELKLPKGEVSWKDSEFDEKLKVPLRLTPSGGAEAAELWVLRDNPIDELNRLVQQWDDHLLNRLSFAVANHKKELTIILRVRLSKQAPPVLVLNGAGFRHYLKLQNLFMPCGSNLHPPLRRDKVRGLLADDPSILTWLYPTDDPTQFQVEQISENAFRPLTDWVEYVIEHEQAMLQEWIQASSFEFEQFICDDGGPDKPKKPPKEDKDRDKPRKSRNRKDQDSPETTMAFMVEADEEEDLFSVELEGNPKPTKDKEREAIELRRKEVEDAFLAVEGTLEAEERQKLWPELAHLNGLLAQHEEAGVCWMNALWFRKSVDSRWIWAWFITEAEAFSKIQTQSRKRNDWTASARQRPSQQQEMAGSALDKLFADKDPNLSDVRALAAYLVWAANQDPFPKSVVDRLNPIQRFLESYEKQLPVRASWLAWTSISKMSGGDDLALARARDRILERLFQSGLRPEHDLPGFLRFSGQPTNQRFRVVKDWMNDLCSTAQKWSRDNHYEKLSDEGKKATPGYVDLIFAFAMARMGEIDLCNEYLDRGTKLLAKMSKPVHPFLVRAFEYRIQRARDNHPHGGPFPDGLIKELDNKLERVDRYAFDRLRAKLKVLEPHQDIDPYSPWTTLNNKVEKELASLTDNASSDKIKKVVENLWSNSPKGKAGHDERAVILKRALNLAPRVGEEYALTLLDRLKEVYNALQKQNEDSSVETRAELLERGMLVAGHFDRAEYVRYLVERFQQLIQAIHRIPASIQKLANLAGQCFRGLRKLGMRDEIDELLSQMRDAIQGDNDLSKVKWYERKSGLDELRALLHVAAGWIYFGKEQQAEDIINSARQYLFSNKVDAKDLPKLSRTYAAAVGQLSVEVAQARLEEMFQKLKNVQDSWTTNAFYSQSHLDVIESVVVAVVNDDFTMGANARRWLDDDEFLVRRRIHQDMRSVRSK